MNMRKIAALALAVVLALSAAACGGKSDSTQGTEAQAVTPLDMLTTVWDGIPEDSRFPAMGGGYDNSVDNAPGEFDVSDTDNLDYLLSVPTESAGLIQSAASLLHMMNMNTFTCGAFQTASSADAKTLAEAMHSSIAAKHWICGFPDKMVIATLGSNVVAMYGSEDLIDQFWDGLTGAYSDLNVLYDEPIL